MNFAARLLCIYQNVYLLATKIVTGHTWSIRANTNVI